MSESVLIIDHPQEEDRYHRQRLISWWDQKRIASARVLVVGAGALGNEILKLLALTGVGRCLIFDPDAIERSNLSRSVLFRDADEGRSKAEVAAARMLEMNPDVRVLARTENVITHAGLGLFLWADVVIAGVDNREARVFVNGACARAGRTWIDGAIEGLSGVVRGFRPAETACYECTMNETDRRLLAERRSCALLARDAVARGHVPSTAVTASIVGALQVEEAIKVLHDQPALLGEGLHIHGLWADFSRVSYPRREECPGHDTLGPVAPLGAGVAGISIGALLDRAERRLGAGAELDLSRDVVLRLTCPSCGRATPGRAVLGSLRERDALCSGCGAHRIVEVAGTVRRGSSIDLACTPADLGLPPYDVIVARRGLEQEAWLFDADAERALGALAGGINVTVLDVRQIADKDLKSARAPAVKQELRVFFAEGAFDRAVTRGDADLTREIGGVLVGELLRDDAGPFLRVDATIDALHAEEKGAELTFTHATWEHIHKEMDSTHDGKKIVGWYHTHPGFGIFLSDRDQFICQSFFNLPFQVALVYDPKSKEHGVFSWRDGQPARSRRYWVGEREHAWDGVRSASGSEGGPAREGSRGPSREGTRPPTSKDDPPRSVRGSAPPVAHPGGRPGAPSDAEARGSEADHGGFDLKSALALALLALVVGGMGGCWYGTRDARNALGQYELNLARLRSEAERKAIGDLDMQLIGMLRSTIGNEAVRRPLDQSLADLDEAEKLFGDAPPLGSPELESGLARLRSARERAQRIREDRGDAQATLANLEQIARQGALSPTEVAHDLGLLKAGLGALYAQLAADAARAGDTRRAEGLLTAAENVDPGNRARYEQQLHPGAPPQGGPPPGALPPGPRPPGAAQLGPPIPVTPAHPEPPKPPPPVPVRPEKGAP